VLYTKPELYEISSSKFSEGACLDGNAASRKLACKQGLEANSGCGPGTLAVDKCVNGNAITAACNNGSKEEI